MLAGIALAGFRAVAAPFLAIGDNAELFLTGNLGLRHDDNVLLTPSKTDDTIITVAPGLALEFGKDALMSGSFTYREEFTRYSDTDSLDSELSRVAFRAGYSSGKTKFGVNANYDQLNQNTVDTPANLRAVLSRRDVVNLGANGEVGVSEKTAVGAGVTYVDTDYKRAGFVDSSILSVPVDVYYELTPKVDLSAGIRIRDTSLAVGADSNDYFYSVGARGAFTPKLSGSVKVGYTVRDFDNGGDRSGLGLDSSLTYLVSPKTSLTLGVSNDFGVSGVGATQENLTFSAGVRTAISPDFSVSANLSHRQIDYFSRKDDYFEGDLGASYTVNEFVSIVGSVTYRENDSRVASGNFTNRVFSIAAQLRY